MKQAMQARVKEIGSNRSCFREKEFCYRVSAEEYRHTKMQVFFFVAIYDGTGYHENILR